MYDAGNVALQKCKVQIYLEWLPDAQIFKNFKNETDILNVNNWKIDTIEESVHTCNRQLENDINQESTSNHSPEISKSLPDRRKRKIVPKRFLDGSIGQDVKNISRQSHLTEVEKSAPNDEKMVPRPFLSDDSIELISIRFTLNEQKKINLLECPVDIVHFVTFRPARFTDTV